jgi:hypothetical protein
VTPATAVRLRLLLLPPTLAAGLWTLLASSTFEDEEPPVPAQVQWALSTAAAPVVVDDGAVRSSATSLRVAGSYEADAGDTLTVIRNGLTVDTTTRLDVDATGLDADDAFRASGTLVVISPLALDADEDPGAGQFTVTSAQTTTIATAAPDGVTLEIGTAPARFLSWQDFRDAAADADEDEDTRLAAVAWRQVTRSLGLAGLAENLTGQIEENAQMLEAMNLNEALTLTCDNADGERVLFWRSDAPGEGSGRVGAGDDFETRFANCLDAGVERFFEGTLTLEDYQPVTGPDRSLGGTFDFAAVFVSEDEIDITTVPTPTSPRITGTLQLRYDEFPEAETPTS